jgi:hypothetical protein
MLFSPSRSHSLDISPHEPHLPRCSCAPLPRMKSSVQTQQTSGRSSHGRTICPLVPRSIPWFRRRRNIRMLYTEHNMFPTRRIPLHQGQQRRGCYRQGTVLLADGPIENPIAGDRARNRFGAITEREYLTLNQSDGQPFTTLTISSMRGVLNLQRRPSQQVPRSKRKRRCRSTQRQ